MRVIELKKATCTLYIHVDLKAPPPQYFLIKFRLLTKTLISIIVGKG